MSEHKSGHLVLAASPTSTTMVLKSTVSRVRGVLLYFLYLPVSMVIDTMWTFNQALSEFLVFMGKPPTYYSSHVQAAEYKALLDMVQKADAVQKRELQDMREQVATLTVSRDALLQKYKQAKVQHDQLQRATKETKPAPPQAPSAGPLSSILPGGGRFIGTHMSVMLALFATRWLSMSDSYHQAAEHRLVSAVICWPVLVIYGLWVAKCVPENTTTPRILTALSWAVVGYVVHAAVEYQLLDERMSTCQDMQRRGSRGM